MVDDCGADRHQSQWLEHLATPTFDHPDCDACSAAGLLRIGADGLEKRMRLLAEPHWKIQVGHVTTYPRTTHNHATTELSSREYLPLWFFWTKLVGMT